MNKKITVVIFYIILMLSWQGAAESGFWPDNIFPSPIEVLEDAYYGIIDQSLLYGLGISMWRLLIGLAISIMLGIILGLLMAKTELVNNTIGSLVLGLQSVPSIAWVPLAILWFGLNDIGIIFVVVIGSVFAITISTTTAVRNINPDIILSARNMGAKNIPAALYVLLPAAFPYLLGGFKQGWAFAWRGVIGAELLFSFLGLGFLLNAGRSLNDVSQVIMVMMVIMVIGLLVDGFVFKKAERIIARRWHGKVT